MSSNSPNSYSLSELLTSIRRCFEANYNQRYWIRAEASSVNVNRVSGHCYLELEEKDRQAGTKAKVRANIWRNSYNTISHKFLSAGLKPLEAGMSILCSVEVQFHEVYGLSLVIHDIDPSYSLGEIARQRQEIINRLTREGVINDNKDNELISTPQRLAIISSPTAAGLEDFIKQLKHNAYQLQFYPILYKAQMQGEATGRSVIAALERVAQTLEHFDAVIVIRGGGSVSELRAFDDYELCYFCTQFPLPIISGIGHDRDTSVLDMVAHTSLKTPTAVAEFLIQRLLGELQHTRELQQGLYSATSLLQTERERRLSELALRLPSVASRLLSTEQNRQSRLRERLGLSAKGRIHNSATQIERLRQILPYLTKGYLSREREKLSQTSTRISSPLKRHQERYTTELKYYEQAIKLSSPEHILGRGFALIRKQGKVIKGSQDIALGDELSISIGKGTIGASVTSVK